MESNSCMKIHKKLPSNTFFLVFSYMSCFPYKIRTKHIGKQVCYKKKLVHPKSLFLGYNGKHVKPGSVSLLVVPVG